MTPPKDIIAFAEQYRDFHFIPGNTYNQDVTEKVHLAQALLIAVEALEKTAYAHETSCGSITGYTGGVCTCPKGIAETALSRIRSL